MISLYFGLPGQGKTTILAKHALEYIKQKRYKNVYSNIPLSISGVTFIDNDCIGQYDLSDCVLLIDEGTLFADSRDFKSFGADKVYYFMMHRHFNCDIEIFVQQWDALDRKIRCITDRVYYVYKRGLLSRWVTRYYQIPYGIIIPDGKSDSQKLGEIIQGYCKPHWLVRLFAPRVWRFKYYKYFDSWEHKTLPSLPSRYKPFVSDDASASDDLSIKQKILGKVAALYGKAKKIRGADKDTDIQSSVVCGEFGTHEDSGDDTDGISGELPRNLAHFER